MITLNQVHKDGGEGQLGIPIHNFASCNVAADGAVWAVYWQGEKIKKAKVNHTIQEIQHKVFVARHGSKPARGVLV